MKSRLLRRATLVVSGGLILWLCASYLCAYVLTRRPKALFEEPKPQISWGSVESESLETIDGERLGAWFVPGSDSGPSVLLLHGNGDCRTKLLPLGRFFHLQGCSVLMLSLRAHGDSTGDVNDIGYSGRHDVVAAIDFLERRCPSRPVLVQGMSLGAAAAIYAAKELGIRVRGYILEATYQDLRTAVSNRIQNRLPAPLDRIAYTGLELTAPFILPDLDSISPLKTITTIPPTVPVLLMAGGRDRESRPAEAEALYRLIKDHAHLVWFNEARHESLYANDPSLYKEAVGSFIKAASSQDP